jgi:hypothetical protein
MICNIQIKKTLYAILLLTPHSKHSAKLIYRIWEKKILTYNWKVGTSLKCNDYVYKATGNREDWVSCERNNLLCEKICNSVLYSVQIILHNNMSLLSYLPTCLCLLTFVHLLVYPTIYKVSELFFKKSRDKQCILHLFLNPNFQEPNWSNLIKFI